MTYDKKLTNKDIYFGKCYDGSLTYLTMNVNLFNPYISYWLSQSS